MHPEMRRQRASAELLEGVTRVPPADHRWYAPVDVAVNDGVLSYDLAATEARAGIAVAESGLLEDFLRLDGAEDAAFARFADTHGVLGLCSHGAVHTACPVAGRSAGELTAIDNPTDHEALDVWRQWVAHAVRLYAYSRQLQGPNPLSAEQRRLLYDEDFGPPPSLHADRQMVAAALSSWLETGDARLLVTWPGQATLPVLAIGAPIPDRGVFAALGLQLAMAAGRAEGLSTCTSCGVLFAPTRRPRAGQRTFCPACRDAGEPVRFAQRDRLARLRGDARREDRS